MNGKNWLQIDGKVINLNNVQYVQKLSESSVLIVLKDHNLEARGDNAKNIWAYFSSAIVSYNITPAIEKVG